MILPDFEFVEPSSISEACTALKQYAGKNKIIAGGTDLMVSMKRKTSSPEVIISLAKISELKGVSIAESDIVKIGAMTNIVNIGDIVILAELFSALVKAAGKIGSQQIRNRATIGGNVCTARPAGDTIGPLIAYGAKAHVVSADGERYIPMEEFFLGPGKTVCEANEILTDILLDLPKTNTIGNYIKFSIRKAMEIALVSTTVVMTLDSDNTCKSARVVLGAVAPTFIRCPNAEAILEGNRVTEELAEQAGLAASQFCSPITDIRASAEYRVSLVQSLVKRCIIEAISGVK